MSEIRLSIQVADAPLAQRLATVLANVPGLKLVQTGEPADATVTEPRMQTTDDLHLSPRETEVLALLAEGASNKEIARRLGISVHTAKFHVGSVIEKLEAVGRTDAVAHAARRGVIHL